MLVKSREVVVDRKRRNRHLDEKLRRNIYILREG